MLKPGATIGILGGGQLGRMLALAAARLGLNCHVFSSERDACSFDVVHRATLADFSDEAELKKFAADCDVITYEFENVPAQAAAFLAARKPVFPNPSVLATTQDRLIEKQFIAGLGIAVAPFAPVGSKAECDAALTKIGVPSVLKTRRLGYDGKGQVTLRKTGPAGNDLVAAWTKLQKAECILEGFVPFEREVSVVATRGRDGAVECFEATENEHRDHILHMSTVPARISPAIAAEARRIAVTIANAFEYVGTLTVEIFIVPERDGHEVLVNEIAPRVHNSGHWTIDGASVSQFEQHIRAVAGWPLGKPQRHGRVEMTNFIGDQVNDAARWLTVPGASLHLYGKGNPRPGRKMGHVTQVFRD